MSTDSSDRRAGLPWVIVIGIAALILVLLQFRRPSGGSDGSQHSGVGRQLPGLELQPLTGDSKILAPADLLGHVTLIDYWGPWCPYCVEEFPHLAALAAKYHDRPDFQLVAVSCGGDPHGDEVNKLRRETEAYLRNAQIDVPTYADPTGLSRQAVMVVAGLDGFGYPTTLLLDRKGIIRGVWEGYEPGSERQMEAAVEKVSDER